VRKNALEGYFRDYSPNISTSAATRLFVNKSDIFPHIWLGEANKCPLYSQTAGFELLPSELKPFSKL
jgi:hypothetical protein